MTLLQSLKIHLLYKKFTSHFCHFTFRFLKLTNVSSSLYTLAAYHCIKNQTKEFMKHFIIGFIIILALTANVAKAQTTNNTQDSTRSEHRHHENKHDGHYHGKHEGHHHRFRLWPWHHHGKGNHRHGHHEHHSDKSDK